MRKLTLLFLVLLLGFNSKLEPKQKKINVLFIGNSFTYHHGIPNILQKMLDENQSNFNIEQSCYPGMSLSDHLNMMVSKREGDDIETRMKEKGEITETEKKLISKKWDFIILQEHPSYYYFPEAITKITTPTIQKIKQLFNNSNCKYINFDIWSAGKKYPFERSCISINNLDWTSDSTDTICSTKIDNLEEEIKRLNQSAKLITVKNNLIQSNHCDLHYKVMKRLPQIVLNENDHHPSEAGSFLNACQFYKLLTNKKASKLNYCGNLSAKEAKLLKEITN